MSKRLAAFIVALLVTPFAACGGHSKPKPVKLPPSVVHACPQAVHDQGAMGECAPPQVQKPGVR